MIKLTASTSENEACTHLDDELVDGTKAEDNSETKEIARQDKVEEHNLLKDVGKT